MFSNIKTCCLDGIEGMVVDVETSISNGLPYFEITGNASVSVKESRERIKSAIKNTGYEYPNKKITMNLYPANMRKSGASFDLPMTIGILAASGAIRFVKIGDFVFIGELSLDGKIRGVNGVLPMVISAKQSGAKSVVVPVSNLHEAEIVDGVNIFAMESLSNLVEFLNGKSKYERPKLKKSSQLNLKNNLDYSDIKGHANAKHALKVAAAGGHSIFMVGSQGSGKTMLAERFPTILPALTYEESLEITKIYSIAGMLNGKEGLVTERPFRSPHHSCTISSLIGGGAIPKFGELSMANRGVLFLDELPEFKQETIESLRQPLDDGFIKINRLNSCVTFPTKCILIGAGNPCKCGYLLEEEGKCTCSKAQIENYRSKISGPLMDRIDMRVEIFSVPFDELISNESDQSSEQMKMQVEAARNIQSIRYINEQFDTNSEIPFDKLEKYCFLNEECVQIISKVYRLKEVTARGYTKTLRISRTIADLEMSEQIQVRHLAQAVKLVKGGAE